MVREVVTDLREKLRSRGLPNVVDDREFDRIFSGLEFIKHIIIKQESDQTSQHKLDLMHRGLSSELRELEKRIADLDDELQQSI